MKLKRKALIGLLVAVIVTPAIVWLLGYQSEQRDPCKQQSRVELAASYPALKALLLQQRFEFSRLLAGQRAQDFMFNVEMSSEDVDLEDVLKMSTQQIEAVAALRQRHGLIFESLCREQVGQ